MTGKSIRDQLWHAADPDGCQPALLDAAALAGRAPTWLQRLGRSVDASWTRLADLGMEQTALMDSIEAAVSLLVPRGWAVMNMDHAAVSGAVAAVRAGNPDDADDLLAGQWEGEGDWRIKRVSQRVRSMAAADAELSALFRARARLLDLAAQHHLAGRYDASVPILLAHIEGIVIDVTAGKKYFTKRPSQKADVVNPDDLAGIEACMAALQGAYGEDVPDTQAAGSLSRHGILHGRELAYDTPRAVDWELKGVPLRLELGPRDLGAGQVTVARRLSGGKQPMPLTGIAEAMVASLAVEQADMLDDARATRDAHTADVSTVGEAVEACTQGSWARVPWSAVGDEGEDELAQSAITVRCLTRADGSVPTAIPSPTCSLMSLAPTERVPAPKPARWLPGQPTLPHNHRAAGCHHGAAGIWPPMAGTWPGRTGTRRCRQGSPGCPRRSRRVTEELQAAERRKPMRAASGEYESAAIRTPCHPGGHREPVPPV